MDEFQANSIAIKTLKQRCEYLQLRLNTVEEENCKLKLEKAQNSNTTSSKEFNNLEERIITLTKEKSKMAHQIQIITNENSFLWEQLSKFLPESNISSLMFAMSGPNKQGVSQFENTSIDYSVDSVEDLSLKLINGMIMRKNELEKQFSKKVDLLEGSIADQSSHKQIDNRITAKNLKDYVQKLNDFKQDLFKQKSDLSKAIMFIKNLTPVLKERNSTNNQGISNLNHLNSFKENNLNEPTSEFSTAQESDGLGNGNQLLDSGKMMCPMCWILFSGTFDDFTAHVSAHFEDE